MLKYKLRPVFIVAMAVLMAVSCGDDPNGPEPDSTPPTVVSTSPTGGAEMVALESTISVTFSEGMAPASITSASFQLDRGVTGTVSYSGQTATLTPDEELDSSTVYTATVTTGVTDEAGNAMATAHTWSFKTVLDSATADLEAPEASIVSPSDSGVVGDAVTIEVDASDNVEVSLVEFYIDGTHVPSADDVAQPFEYVWDLTGLTAGSPITLHAIAYDTAGNSGSSAVITVFYLWRGRASLDAPPADAIVGNSVYINVVPPVGANIDVAKFYIDSSHVTGADDALFPYEYTWDASGSEIGSTHTISAVLIDSADNQIHSDTITVHYLWQLLIADGNEEPQARDIRNVFTRSTDSTLEFRVETNGDWDDYRDTSGIDMAFFFDTDRNRYTGRTEAGGNPINDIGAEYKAVIGFFQHGDSLFQWSEFAQGWQAVHGIEGFAGGSIPADTNVFEISIYRSQIGAPSYKLDIVLANVQLITAEPEDWRWDWAPDDGHATYNVLTPSLFTASATPRRELSTAAVIGKPISNPFD